MYDACYYWQEAFRTVGGGILALSIAEIHALGAILMVSTGGETEEPYAYSANAYGTFVGTWAKNYLMDGIDFDMENFYPVSFLLFYWCLLRSVCLCDIFLRAGGCTLCPTLIMCCTFCFLRQGFVYDKSPGAAIEWLITVSVVAKSIMTAGGNCGPIITHAPQVCVASVLLYLRITAIDTPR